MKGKGDNVEEREEIVSDNEDMVDRHDGQHGENAGQHPERRFHLCCGLVGIDARHDWA